MLDIESSFMRLENKEQPKEEKRCSFVKVYKRKKFFNRLCHFEDQDETLLTFPPSKTLAKNCFMPELAEKGIQNKPMSAEDSVNTEELQFASEG